MWSHIRQELKQLADILVSRFATVSQLKIRSDGESSQDTNMYDGSGGVVFGLWKYSLLLKKEVNDGKQKKEYLWEVEQLLEAGVNANIELITIGA